MVRNQKTHLMAGHAMLSFDKSGIAKLEAYNHIVCLQIVHGGLPSNVFLSWNDKAIMLVNISKQIHLQLVKAEIFNYSLPKNISCSIIRQTVVSAVHEEKLDHEQKVADLMAHSLKTAGQSYYLGHKIQTAGDANNLIRKHFDGCLSCISVSKWRV